MQEEIRAVRLRLAEDPSNLRLARRLDNLHHRLEQPLEVSARQIERLEVKIRRAIRRRIFEEWRNALQVELEANLTRTIGITEFPDWLREARHQQSLAAVLQLRGSARTVGLRLFRIRCGPAPWHLASEPANQKFITRMQSLGMDPAVARSAPANWRDRAEWPPGALEL